jgi:hypothetical protein
VLKVVAHVRKEILTEFFGLLDLGRLRAGNMEIHRLVRLLASAVFHEATASSFDLDSTARLLLDMLHIGASLANHLCSKVEPRNVLHIYWDPLFRPFSLVSY